VDFTIPTNVEVLCEFGSGLTGTGSSGNDYLASFGGANTLIGSGGNDTFVFLPGLSNGTTIADFNGNGPDAGDTLLFFGYGTATEGATLTQSQVDPTHWSINSSDGWVHDIITLANGAAVHQSDYLFV
jgi:Ca2+-binding RTX toxin-like protein